MPEKLAAIRPLERQDLELVAKWRQSSAAIEAFFSADPVSLSTQGLWYEAYLRDQNDMMFVIILDDGTPVGTIALVNIDHRNQKAEYARLLIGDPTFKRKGVAESASRELLAFGFKQLHLTKIYLEVFETNHAAVSLYKKLGFETEGRFRSEIFSRGIWQNVLRMSVFLDVARTG